MQIVKNIVDLWPLIIQYDVIKKKKQRMTFDLIIRQGRVLDPSHDLDQILDIGITDGKITALEANLDCPGLEEIDAEGLFVSPGWIDIHTHLYEYATPLGINPDKYCLKQGIESWFSYF